MLDVNNIKSTSILGKFNGERLRSARLYREMTITELAAKLDVSKQSISQYENGIIEEPKVEVLFKMIHALNFPKNYFFEKSNAEIKIGSTFFRASSRMLKKEEYKNIEKTRLIGHIYRFLNEYIEFPELNLPKQDEYFKKLSIEDKALELRKYWGLGEDPIDDIIYVMESNGIIMSSMYTDSENVDAFNQPQIINGEVTYIVVLGNDNNSATRRQFSAAHELGHIILHDGFLNMDELSKDEQREIEAEAHEFASAFLLPKKTFSRDMQLYSTNLDYYIELKKKWSTSISAMVVRANRLGLIDSTEYQSLWRKISRNGWRLQEPLDNILKMNFPTVLKSAVDMLLDNEILNEIEFMKELSLNEVSLNWEEVESLLGLEENRLKPIIKGSNNIINLEIKK